MNPAAQLRRIATQINVETDGLATDQVMSGDRIDALVADVREIADHLDTRHDLIDDTDAFYAKQFPDVPPLTRERLWWRHDFLTEELRELDDAILGDDAEGVVDACVDLIVVALGTLKEAGVDIRKAWTTVHEANMQKLRGTQIEKREGSAGFDLVKPTGWVAPDHSDNVGTLKEEALA